METSKEWIPITEFFTKYEDAGKFIGGADEELKSYYLTHIENLNKLAKVM